MSEHALKLAFLNPSGAIHPQYNPYDYLHRMFEVSDEALWYAERFQNNPADTDRWHQQEARLWAGQTLKRTLHIYGELPWLPGAREVTALLRGAGVAIVLISGDFDLHMDLIAAEIGGARVFANRLGVENERLTGTIELRVDEAHKGRIVDQVMQEVGAAREACLALGSTRTDIPVFERVGWSAAIAPYDDKVRAAASLTLPEQDLTPLVPLLRERLGLA